MFCYHFLVLESDDFPDTSQFTTKPRNTFQSTYSQKILGNLFIKCELSYSIQKRQIIRKNWKTVSKLTNWEQLTVP